MVGVDSDGRWRGLDSGRGVGFRWGMWVQLGDVGSSGGGSCSGGGCSGGEGDCLGGGGRKTKTEKKSILT